MTEKEARAILESYQETDEDTGEKYGFCILKSLGADGDGFAFECKADGAESSCTMGVYPGGEVLCIPT